MRHSVEPLACAERLRFATDENMVAARSKGLIRSGDHSSIVVQGGLGHLFVLGLRPRYDCCTISAVTTYFCCSICTDHESWIRIGRLISTGSMLPTRVMPSNVQDACMLIRKLYRVDLRVLECLSLRFLGEVLMVWMLIEGCID